MGKKWNTGLLATVWSSSTPQPTPDLLFKSVENNIQKITKREATEQLECSDRKPVILTLAKQINTGAGKLAPSWSYKKLFRELTDLYTKSVTFSKHSVNDSNFNSAVLKAAKEPISRGRRRYCKPYWNKTLKKIHKELSEAREEMDRNPTHRM